MKILDWLFDKLFPPREPSKYGEEYDSATTLERAAVRACDKKMFQYARQRRRDILLGKGIMPWF